MTSPADMGVVDMADAISGGHLSAEAAVAAAFERAESLAGLNAIVDLEFEPSMSRARFLDGERLAGRLLGPLHGVPMAHKDMFHRAGVLCECGSLIRRGFVAETTATLISRLETAGAVTIGRLHMAEFAMGPTGHNAHLGRCLNPWDRQAITGGSSSGSGAAVAARIVPAALGSDTGGSVRLPAAFCGVVGLKPTQGLLPTDAMMPLSTSMDNPGPLCRSSRDAARLMTILTGGAADYEVRIGHALDGVTIGLPDTYYLEGLDVEIGAAIEKVAALLGALGARVVEVAVPDNRPYTDLAASIWAPEAARVHHGWLVERSPDYGPQVRNRLMQGQRVGAADYLRALEERLRARNEMIAGPFSNCDLLLTPTTRMTTPRADAVDAAEGPKMEAMIAELSALTRTISMLGFPALATPMGFDQRGMPMGLQLIGPPYSETLLLQVGHAYEKATDWLAHRPNP